MCSTSSTLSDLTPYTSNAEVERILTECGVKLKSAIGGKPYAVDYHYEIYVLASINTVEDALQMCDRLDEECGGKCNKAQEIREWLAKPFWQESPSRIRSAMSANRRVVCRAHESYSFAVDPRCALKAK